VSRNHELPYSELDIVHVSNDDLLLLLISLFFGKRLGITMAMSDSSSGRVYADAEAFCTDFFQHEEKDKSSFFLEQGVGLEFKSSENGIPVAITRRPGTLFDQDEDGPWRVENIWVLSDHTVCITAVANRKSMAFVVFKSPEWGIICSMPTDAEWSSSSSSSPPTTDTMAGVIEGANRYMSANRASDGKAMSRIFHSICRLTYVDAQGKVVAISQPEFCTMVTNRWTTKNHSPYAHLKDDPRLQHSDQLLGVTMLGPNHAIVKLTVGFPPFLYTDVLFFARVEHQWWIVHKSSVNDPFLVDQAKVD
jgi:hypothetical protein